MAAEIRQYRDTDRAALVATLRELQLYICSLDELKRTRQSADFDGEAYVCRLLEKVQGQGVIYLADDEGKIVGCVAGVISERNEDDLLEAYPSKDGRILEPYVQSGHRGQKIGVRLMQAIEQYFRDHGCIGCHVDCFAPNIDAHKFYVSLGYVDRLISLLKLFGKP